jgi:hypothetical protein
MRLALLAATTLWAIGCGIAHGGEDIAVAPASDDGGTVSSEGDTGGGDDAPAREASPPADTGPGHSPADTATGTPPPAAGSLDAARVACVDGINAYRATLGLAAYAGWTSAASCADGEAKADSESGTAHGAFGQCGESAQNECPGWPGPPDSLLAGCLKMMWDEGPGQPFSAHGHYINMSSTTYTSVACGFFQMSTGSWWAVQNFR